MTIALILITIALGIWLVRQWSRGDLAGGRPRRRSAPLLLQSARSADQRRGRRAA